MNVIYNIESDEAKAEYLKEYNERFLSPNEAVHMGYVDEIIEPEATKGKIISILNLCANDNIDQLAKFHGNIPL